MDSSRLARHYRHRSPYLEECEEDDFIEQEYRRDYLTQWDLESDYEWYLENCGD